MAQRAQRAPAGARSLTGQSRLGSRLVPWLTLLVLAAIVALVAWMVIRNNDDDDAFPAPAEWTSAHHADPVPV